MARGLQTIYAWLAVCLLFDTVSAQCNNATTTLRNAADVAAIATCTTFTGSIVVATDVAPLAEIRGVETVEGSVIVANNSGLTTIATDLQVVTESVILDTLPLLSNITLPQWSSVDTLILNKIPAPNVLNMQTTVQRVNNLYITDTTLETLFGLLLQTAQMENLQITGNKFLQNCWFGVGNITQQATILDNSGQLMLTLPNLTYAYNMDISNASAISMPLLKSVSQSLDISWNEVTNLTLPELSFVGENFSLRQNSLLTELSLDALVNVQGDLVVTGNAQLADLAGLESLSYVGNDLTIEGDIDNATLASLHSVRGDLRLVSTGDATCSDIPSSAVEGQYNCFASGAANAKHHGAGLSGGVIAGIVIGCVCAIALATGLALWAGRRRRKATVQEIAHQDSPPPPPPKEKRGSSHGYYDIASAGEVLEAGRSPESGKAVLMQDLKSPSVQEQPVREMRRREEHELPANEQPAERHELHTEAAHELATPLHRTVESRAGDEIAGA